MPEPLKKEQEFGKGALRDVPDPRDYPYEPVFAAAPPVTAQEWQTGFDVRQKLGIPSVPIKNQFASLSCVGQAYAYYTAILNFVETGKYDEVSAKAIYSKIRLPQGGAYFRDGAALLVDFGALLENIVKSYKTDNTTDETFIRDTAWITPEIVAMAKVLQAKEYRLIGGIASIDVFAQAIRDNYGIVFGVEGVNNGSWNTLRPIPPTTQSDWGHALYGIGFGINAQGKKTIYTPNSWGDRFNGAMQEITEDYFVNNNRWMFNPWVLVDKPNFNNLLSEKPMIFKKQGSPALYVAVGDTLIPFNTDFLTYQADFSSAKIIELTPAEFAKCRVATSVVINKK